MNIYEVETFLTIIRAKSINKAADMLFISQSATSQRLISLEKELGFALIERRKGYKTVELTTKGELFLPLAQKWYALYNEMNELTDLKVRLPLHVGGMGSINNLILTDLYRKLSDGTYGVSFDLTIRTNWSDELYELLDRRKIDLALVSEAYVFKNIKVEPLFNEKMYIVMLKDKKHENRTAFHPSELNREHEIYLSWSDSIDIWRNQWWKSDNLKHIYLDAPSILPYFITDANKWAFMPSSMLGYMKTFDKFDFFEIEDSPPERTVYLITHKNPRASRIENINQFKIFAQKYISEKDGLLLSI